MMSGSRGAEPVLEGLFALLGDPAKFAEALTEMRNAKAAAEKAIEWQAEEKAKLDAYKAELAEQDRAIQAKVEAAAVIEVEIEKREADVAKREATLASDRAKFTADQRAAKDLHERNATDVLAAHKTLDDRRTAADAHESRVAAREAALLVREAEIASREEAARQLMDEYRAKVARLKAMVEE